MSGSTTTVFEGAWEWLIRLKCSSWELLKIVRNVIFCLKFQMKDKFMDKGRKRKLNNIWKIFQ
jgi:hypothetical protein